MQIADYLAAQMPKEEMPAWLRDFGSQSAFTRRAFFGARTVFYPGSGRDSQPIQLFASAQAAHCFVQVDYGLSEAEAGSQHLEPALPGYRACHRVPVEEGAFAPDGWIPHAPSRVAAKPGQPQQPLLETRQGGDQPYAFLEILEKQASAAPGPARLAILYLSADGVAAYDALYCQKYPAQSPLAVVLQDHAFGSGNYTRFGEGGLLAQLAQRCRVLPSYLLSAKGTRLWQAFKRVPGLAGLRPRPLAPKRYLAQHADGPSR